MSTATAAATSGWTMQSRSSAWQISIASGSVGAAAGSFQSAVSRVVNLSPQPRQRRRRRVAWMPAIGRVSNTPE